MTQRWPSPATTQQSRTSCYLANSATQSTPTSLNPPLPASHGRDTGSIPNILATNGTIHAEAEKYLYENNDFVIVSFKYQWPIGELAPLKWIPLVSTRFAARLRNHPLRLHFVGNCGNGTQADSAAPKVQSAINHRDHLPELYLAGKLQVSFTSGPVAIVAREARQGCGINVDFGGLGAPGAGVVRPPAVMVELRNTKYRPMTAARQNALLAPLKTLVGEAVRLSVTGAVRDTASIKGMKSLLGPQVVWAPAMHWKFYETLQAIRKIADLALLAGDAEYATLLFRGLELAMHNVARGSNSGQLAKTRSMEEAYRIMLMAIEIMLTIAFKKLSEGNPQEFLDLCGTIAVLGQKILGLRVAHPIPPSLQAAFFHTITLETI